MRPRRVAPLLVAALVAAAGSFGAAAARASGTATSSSGKICVALVVDGRALGSNVSTSCATVSKGATGVDVLHAAGHRLTFRSDGLICAIDGLPKGGCSAVDSSHYWAYFHRAPGSTSWTYSSDNESTYRPANKSTEGWAYDDGTPHTPQNVPYAQICKPAPKPSPSATHTRHRRHHPTPAPTAARHSAHAKPTATPSRSPSSRSHPTSHPATKRKHHHRDNAIETETETVKTQTPQPSSTSAALVGGTSGSSSGGHALLGLVIGLAVVAALGTLAAIRFRRSS